jgi:glucose-1-phosphate thymidylyltransferase
MKIIIPMAGMGKRMRPHTLTIPKPLIPVAGKPIVQWLAEDITAACDEDVEEIAFITGRFGEEIEKKLISIAKSMGAKGTICYQDEALGTAHAILCAANSLKGKVVVAFADTLFKMENVMNTEEDSIIWVKRVVDPSSFGVVKLDGNNYISEFIEKPKEFVSDLAIIGIYYFRDGERLKKELQYLIDNNIRGNNEFQLTDALENMKQKGVKFGIEKVQEWLDCGNKNATVYTNQRMLEIKKHEISIPPSLINNNSKIIPPCSIGNDVKLINSTIGPHVSIGNGTIIENSTITDSIVQSHTIVKNSKISNSMIGNHVLYTGNSDDLSIGDFNHIG